MAKAPGNPQVWRSTPIPIPQSIIVSSFSHDYLIISQYPSLFCKSFSWGPDCVYHSNTTCIICIYIYVHVHRCKNMYVSNWIQVYPTFFLIPSHPRLPTKNPARTTSSPHGRRSARRSRATTSAAQAARRPGPAPPRSCATRRLRSEGSAPGSGE